VINDYRQKHPEASVRQMCQMLGISRSWLYEKPVPTEPTQEATSLRDAIERLCLAFPGYGYRRVTAQLHRDGWAVNHKRVLNVMRGESLLCRLQRAFVPPSPGSTRAAYPNLLPGFVVTKLNQVWVVDITYIRLPQGFVYLACVLDAFSRRCIGWHLSRDIDTRLTLAALNAAIAARSPSAGLIHHSDRGVQYASAEYVARLEQIGASLSMSKAGCPYDNAKAESFFKTLKKEEVYLSQYQNFEEARANLGAFLNDVYNVKRLHSSLGYLPPTEFEEQLTKKSACASKS
jgi:transposase InsO family protein